MRLQRTYRQRAATTRERRGLFFLEFSDRSRGAPEPPHGSQVQTNSGVNILIYCQRVALLAHQAARASAARAKTCSSYIDFRAGIFLALPGRAQTATVPGERNQHLPLLLVL